MIHYSHKSIPDAKFEADSVSSFGDMTKQKFPWKKGTSNKIRLFIPGNGFSLNKKIFYVQSRSSRLKIDPIVQISNSQADEIFFHFQNFWDVSTRNE